MNRKRMLIGTGCLVSLVTFTTLALTQDEVPARRQPSNSNRPEAYDTKSETPNRQNVVIRLQNSQADTIAQSVAEFYSVNAQFDPNLEDWEEGFKKEVVLVPDKTNNSLLLSATPRYFTDVEKMILKLDARPDPNLRLPNVIYPASSPDGIIRPHRVKLVARTAYEELAVPISDEELKQLQAMQAAKVKLKKAQNETTKKEATDVIQQNLVKQFEQDLVQREKELAAVEERLKTLRQQLEKRKQAKDEIVTLRLKTIVNNAEGLGFPGDDAPQSSGEDDAASFHSRPGDSYSVKRREPVYEPPNPEPVRGNRPIPVGF